MSAYETVIGLEVHVELSTATKLFCGCPNQFGAEPNTNVCPVCLGLPGSLPVLNERVVEYALRIGEALHFTVPERSIFHRKNYFYPDMPKDFQTSQYDEPICADGWIEVDGDRIRIERAQMEEDTGKSTHVGGGGRIHDADHSLVDYNRAGVPLMEIVSRPEITSAEQARGYVTELRAILLAIGVSDVKMEEGSMRVDANVSIRPEGATELGTKVEIKNMNSIRSLGRAIEFEVERQSMLADAGERIVQETRHWDEESGVTHGMRSKEGSSDYRYFPEPDLVPVAPTDAMRAAAIAAVPELPAARRSRLVTEWGISEHDARVLVATPGLAGYADAAVAALTDGTARDVVNWCTGELLAHGNETGAEPAAWSIGPSELAELVGLVAQGAISRGQAKEVLAGCLAGEGSPRAVADARGLAQVSDEGALGAIVDAVLAANADAVAEYREGDDKARKKKRGFLMGEAMKASKGQGNPQLLNRLLDERLG
ncbi:MAG: Asp-tRNA(Asn)/Glu-tRNA(Gln) amidotransferase subunit GatB [Actinomycetes bacterium]